MSLLGLTKRHCQSAGALAADSDVVSAFVVTQAELSVAINFGADASTSASCCHSLQKAEADARSAMTVRKDHSRYALAVACRTEAAARGQIVIDQRPRAGSR